VSATAAVVRQAAGPLEVLIQAQAPILMIGPKWMASGKEAEGAPLNGHPCDESAGLLVSMDGQFVCWHVPTQVLSGLTNVVRYRKFGAFELTPIQPNNKFTEATNPTGKSPWVTPKLSLMQSDDTEAGKGGALKEPNTQGVS